MLTFKFQCRLLASHIEEEQTHVTEHDTEPRLPTLCSRSPGTAYLSKVRRIYNCAKVTDAIQLPIILSITIITDF